MQSQHGGNDQTGRTAEQHIKNSEGNGGSVKNQHGANDQTGRTAERHATECGGRAMMHVDAMGLLFGNWNALPWSWKPRGSKHTGKRSTSWTAGKAREDKMLDHLLSYHKDVLVGAVRSDTKLVRAGRYNALFEYKPGDPGFLVVATDGRGGHGRASKPKHAKHAGQEMPLWMQSRGALYQAATAT
jgi:hypothetical protein